MVRRTAPMTGQLTFDDCTPDWREPKPRRQSAGARYHLSPCSDLRGQRIPDSRRRIITVPISQEYL
ncbi:hypothetical protein ACKI14_02490 [Streptomyces turgidiscabies]|uniref:hypothetical protein n=1 Tax=Streptomyces turgidiscabies TaxID=85558 RepID=UPI0038F79BE3